MSDQGLQNQRLLDAHHDDRHDREEIEEDPNAEISLETALQKTGEFGKYQYLVMLFINMVWFPVSYLMTALPYMELEPEFECEKHGEPGVYKSCSQNSYCDATNRRINKKGIKSLVTDFELYCDRRVLIGLCGTMLFVGAMVGMLIFPRLADLYGRKRILLIFIIATPIFHSSLLLANSIGVLLFLLFLGGTLLTGGILSFVLGTELYALKYRHYVGTSLNLFFANIEMIGPIFSIWEKNWRILLIPAIIFGVLALIAAYWLDESPRNCATRGKFKQAHKILDRMSDYNRTPKITQPLEGEHQAESANGTNSLVETNINAGDNDSRTRSATSTDPKAEKRGFKDLFRNRRHRRNFLVCCFAWFVSSYSYYGVIFDIPNLKTNPNYSGIMLAAVEFVAVLTSGIIADRFGRKKSIITCFWISGFSFILNWFWHSWKPANYILLAGGKFGVSATFNIAYLYSSELFPTTIRSTAAGLCSMTARVGGALAPLTVSLFSILGVSPLTAFGFAAVIAGGLSFLLPETKGVQAPDDLEDEDDVPRQDSLEKQDEAQKAFRGGKGDEM